MGRLTWLFCELFQFSFHLKGAFSLEKGGGSTIRDEGMGSSSELLQEVEDARGVGTGKKHGRDEL